MSDLSGQAGSKRRPYLISPADRRGLSRVEAAEYTGVSVGLFDAMVADRRMPPAKRINARLVWDRHKVDEAFSALPDADEEMVVNPVDAALDAYEAELAAAGAAGLPQARRREGIAE